MTHAPVQTQAAPAEALGRSSTAQGSTIPPGWVPTSHINMGTTTTREPRCLRRHRGAPERQP